MTLILWAALVLAFLAWWFPAYAWRDPDRWVVFVLGIAALGIAAWSIGL